MFRRIIPFLTILVMLAFHVTAYAQTSERITLTYQGKNFTSLSGTGPPTTSNYISVSITVDVADSKLKASFTNTDVTLISWSMSDGANMVTNLTPSTSFDPEFSATPSANGLVVNAWRIQANSTFAAFTNGLTLYTSDAFFNDYSISSGGIASAPHTGTWSTSGYSPPPPPSPLTITTTSLPDAVSGQSYSTTLAATGGQGAITWSLASGPLPTGFALSSGGVLSSMGNPAATPNTYSFSVIATDGVQTTTPKPLSLVVRNVVRNPLKITTTSLPNAVSGQSYSTTLAATGGQGAITWSLASGNNLPASFTLSSMGVLSSTGILLATPGTYHFTVVVTDSTGATAQKALTLIVQGGLVFSPDPITISGDTSLTINSATSLLDAQRQPAMLQGLDGSGYLIGVYATTMPSAEILRAYETSLVFSYTHSDSRFHEVMCYYHTDAIERYIQSLGFKNIENRTVGLNVDGISDDNSFYSPNGSGTGFVTFGTGGVPDAEDAMVIWHENGHAIQDNQVPGWGQSHESKSMGEGFGDYWAASAFAGVGPNAPAWDVFFDRWDSTPIGQPASNGNPPYLRRLDSTKHYPKALDGEEHDDGEIWSACLWQIRTLVGRTQTDTMILESHFSVPTNGTFADGANAILDANQLLYNGANQTAIKQIFIARGILSEVKDVTANVSVTRGGFSYNRTTKRFIQTVTLKNTSNTSISGPISLVMDALSSNATLFNNTGITSVVLPSGSPYINIAASNLAAGASASMVLEFTNPSNQGIVYSTRVLAGSGDR